MIAFIRQTAHKRRCFYITPIIVYNRNTSFTLLFFTFLFSPLLVFSGFSPLLTGVSALLPPFSDALLFTVFDVHFPLLFQAFHHPIQVRRTKHLSFLIQFEEIEFAKYPLHRNFIHIIPPYGTFSKTGLHDAS